MANTVRQSQAQGARVAVSFLDTRDGTLIAGDVFTAYGRVAVTSHLYLRLPFAYFPTWDRAVDLASARALRALDPAHG